MEIILGKYGELALKGLNKNQFENSMVRTIRKRVEHCGEFRVHTAQSTVYVEPENDEADIDEAYEEIKRIFGLSAVVRAAVCEKDLTSICETAESYLGSRLDSVRSFKVNSKRADKKFPMTSMELSREVGAYLIDRHGKKVTRANVFAVLYEDRQYDHSMQKQLDVIIRSLRDTLRKYGIDDIFELNRGYMRVCPEKIHCDMYRFMNGDMDVINSYRGEYMSAYSWATITEAFMEQYVYKQNEL